MSLAFDILNGIETQLRTITKDNDYDTSVITVLRTPQNPSDIVEHQTPMITVTDKSHPKPAVFDGTNYLYLRDFVFTGWVKTDDPNKVAEQLCNLDSSIKRWAHTVTLSDIHANVLDIQLGDTPMYLNHSNMKLGGVHIIVRLIYHTDGNF